MNETRWDTGSGPAGLGLIDFMPDEPKEQSDNQPKKRRKTSFDAEDDVAIVLEYAKENGVDKGAVVNLCVKLAWRRAFDELGDALKSFQKPERPPGAKKPKAGNKL